MIKEPKYDTPPTGGPESLELPRFTEADQIAAAERNFKRFLEQTNEKEVVSRAIGEKLQTGSLLDIGAGTGDIPDLIGVDPADYTAIEQSADYAATLRNKGYSVVEELFPCECPEKTYNNILMSFVLRDITKCAEPLEAAQKLLDESGQLIVVTYRDTLDDCTQLMHMIGDTRRPTSDERFDFLQGRLSEMGELDVQQVRSYIFGESLEELTEALSFIATRTTPDDYIERYTATYEKIIALAPYLEERYSTPNGYAFPMDHYMLSTKK